MEHNNNYNEPIKEGNPYGEPIQNPYVNKPADDYSYGEAPAAEQPIVEPANYSTPEPVQEPAQQTYEYIAPEQSYCEPQKPEKTGLAVAALVLGIISVVISCMGLNIILAIIAIILGAVYLSKKQAAKRGMAIAGLVLGIISIALFVLMVVLVVVFMVSGAFGMFASDPLYSEMYNEILNGMY